MGGKFTRCMVSKFTYEDLQRSLVQGYLGTYQTPLKKSPCCSGKGERRVHHMVWNDTDVIGYIQDLCNQSRCAVSKTPQNHVQKMQSTPAHSLLLCITFQISKGKVMSFCYLKRDCQFKFKDFIEIIFFVWKHTPKQTWKRLCINTDCICNKKWLFVFSVSGRTCFSLYYYSQNF